MAANLEKNEYAPTPWDVPPEDTEYTLEEILEEYGSSRQQKILKEVEEAVAPQTDPPPAEPPAAQTVPDESAQPLSADSQKPSLSDEAHETPGGEAEPVSDEEPDDEPELSYSLTLEELVGATVDSVMDEQEEPILVKHRRGLFSRKQPIEETEQFYDSMQTPPEPRRISEADSIGEEPDLEQTAAKYRQAYRRQHSTLNQAFLTALLPLAAMAAEQYGITVPFWTGNTRVQGAVMLACLLADLIFCVHVPIYGMRQLMKKRLTSPLLVFLAALLAAIDCGLWLFFPDHSGVTPYASVAGLALFFAQWGICRESRGTYDSFRMASIDTNPPYLVTETGRGPCKQRGSVHGFYTTARRSSCVAVLQTVFLPLIFAATLVFAVLIATGNGQWVDFPRNWSAILLSGATFALPLCWGLPWSQLTRRQQKSGCAVAGWDGAARISRRRSLILSDTDLFPPGTIRLNGVKVYGEELGKVSAYAAAASKAAGIGLARLFEGLAVGETIPIESTQDLNFFEQGGLGCTIWGESVLLGTASFMRKQDVRLPSSINLKTGIFLSIDHQLAAVFAVKYEASENVDFALRMLRRNRITPILAVRDPNITPALLKRKFHKQVRVEYPDLTTRVALSEAEEDRGLPRALLLREGLLPYAEAVAGSRRLRTAVFRATVLSLLGSAAGVLLTTYLLSLEKFDLLSPLSLAVFLLLWTLPVLLMSDWTSRY